VRRNPVRAAWDEGRPATNLWIDIAAPVTVEALAKLPYDSFTVDLQHCLVDRGALPSLLQAISLGNGAPMVRVSQNDPGEIGFALDAGAYGVVCPTVETGDQARRFVDACDYPPRGSRSWGPVRGLLYGGADYFERYAGEILRIALVETAEGMRNLEAIAATPGLDMVYLGPNDLGVSHGARPSYTPNHPEVERAMEALVKVAKAKSIAAGIHAASAQVAKTAAKQGYTFLSLGYASKIMVAAAAQVLTDARP
jgi:4-hydroxy-2-oxoheptanedioate aldolase